jgi:hypothetical protein
MCNIDGWVRGVVGNGFMDSVKNIGQDISNGLSSVEQAVAKPVRSIEQGLSGGQGWGGLGKNAAAVIAAPATGGASLAGSTWAENALSGKPVLGNQDWGSPGQSGQSGQPNNNGGVDWGDIAKTGLDITGNYLGSQAQADVARRGQDLQAKAYQEMMGRSKEGEGQFLGALNEPNQALGSYAKDIQDMGQQNIGRQQNIINQQLGRAGVKGGQAANLYGRQIGELQQNGMRDVNKLAYEDAQNRANRKSTYFANKGQSGFNLVPKYS